MDQPTELKFDTVDVFTSKRYAGNPLAIVHVPADKTVPQETKQRIANEFNLSETVILHENPQDPLDRKVDIFIPNREIPFAGHPTIGTLCHIARAVQASSPIAIKLRVKAGTIDATFDPAAGGTATASIPHEVLFHGHLAPDAQQLPFPLSTAPPAHARLPYPLVSPVRGMTFALVELPDADALAACRQDMVRHVESRADAAVRELAKPTLVGTYFWQLTEVKRGDGGKGGDGGVDTMVIEVRMLLDDTPPEDPATGSAACTLASALSTWRRAGGADVAWLHDQGQSAFHKPACWEKIKVDEKSGLRDRYEITQGKHMGRESHISVEVVMKEDGSIEKVLLSGQAVDVMRGRLVC